MDPDQLDAQPSQSRWRKVIRSVLLALVSLVLLGISAVYFVPVLAVHLPDDTWRLVKSDAIVVLGTPANRVGKPSPVMRERVDKGVQLLKEGYAANIIFTGTHAHNRYVEADVMADLARQEGVRGDLIVIEPEAQNTCQNAFCSVEIMKEHGWKSAVVVTSPAHALRSNFIFSQWGIKYCVVPSKDPPEWSPIRRLQFDWRERIALLRMILLGHSSNFDLSERQIARSSLLKARN